MNKKNIPVHVAIIMDGNGRWAKKRGLPRMIGHRKGVEVIGRVIEEALNLGIRILTLYTFSVENWKRPKREIDNLMKLLKEYLAKKKKEFSRRDIRLNVIGRLSDLPIDIQKEINKVINETKDNSKLVLNLALSYGGRPEIVDATRRIIEDISLRKIELQDIDEKTFSSYLYTANLPDPDLLIRTSGEMRISNFLLWQISYTELYFSKKLWPSFTKEDFRRAIRSYQKRKRRFGEI
jgi:undecaprenyl diphosphate synthase